MPILTRSKTHNSKKKRLKTRKMEDPLKDLGPTGRKIFALIVACVVDDGNWVSCGEKISKDEIGLYVDDLDEALVRLSQQ